LPEAVKKGLASSQEAIRRQIGRQPDGQRILETIRWVDPASIHLTLVFLGAVTPDQMPLVQDGIRRVASNSRPFILGISGLGVFPSWTRPRVVWVGVEEEGGTTLLGPLQDAIADEMAALGFEKEARCFNPHLTLARVRETATPEEKRVIGAVIKNVPGPASQIVAVNEVSLMRSQLSPRGAHYTRLAAFALAPLP